MGAQARMQGERAINGVSGLDRSLQLVTAEALAEGLRRTPLEQCVVWTGEQLHGLSHSRIARVLGCISEVNTPIPLRVLIQRAARIEGDAGVPPDALRNAVRQHQSAQPAVLLLVERRPCGDYAALFDIPFPSGRRGRMPAGTVVIASQEMGGAGASDGFSHLRMRRLHPI